MDCSLHSVLSLALRGSFRSAHGSCVLDLSLPLKNFSWASPATAAGDLPLNGELHLNKSRGVRQRQCCSPFARAVVSLRVRAFTQATTTQQVRQSWDLEMTGAARSLAAPQTGGRFAKQLIAYLINALAGKSNFGARSLVLCLGSFPLRSRGVQH